MFGNGITVVDVIFAPIMQRIRIAKQIRGLDVPEEYAVRVGVVFNSTLPFWERRGRSVISSCTVDSRFVMPVVGGANATAPPQ